MTIRVDAGEIIGTLSSLLKLPNKSKASDDNCDQTNDTNNDVGTDLIDSFVKTDETSEKEKNKADEVKEREKARKAIQDKIEEISNEMKEIMAKIITLANGEERGKLQAQYDELNSQWSELLSQLTSVGDNNNDTSSEAAPTNQSGGNSGAMTFQPTSPEEQYLLNYGQMILSGLNNKAQQIRESADTYYTDASSRLSYAIDCAKGNNKTSSVQKPVTKTIDPKVAKGLDAKLGDGFSAKVEQVAANINCDPNDLLAMMYSESGINPHTVGYNGATGLIQFLPSTAKELGVSPSALKNMSAIEQMDYVEKFFMKNKKMFLSEDAELDAGTLYSLCFLPARAKKEIQCEKNGVLAGAYRKNSGVDMDKDGKITKTDLSVRMNKKYNEMYKQYAR